MYQIIVSGKVVKTCRTEAVAKREARRIHGAVYRKA